MKYRLGRALRIYLAQFIHPLLCHNRLPMFVFIWSFPRKIAGVISNVRRSAMEFGVPDQKTCQRNGQAQEAAAHAATRLLTA